MLVITGFFNDEDRFIPDKPVKVPQNTKVKITIEEETEEIKRHERVKWWEEIELLLEESKDEILPDDFPVKKVEFRAPEEIEF